MLEKSAKLANLIQGIGLALYLCSYFSQREAADRAMVHSMGHPSWLPLFSIIFLAIAVLTSSVLTLLVLSNKRIDLRGKIVRGYLDLRAPCRIGNQHFKVGQFAAWLFCESLR